MRVTLRQLKVFEAVARHLSFTRAAEELHLTQPAVSMQIRQLEEAVELALFEHLGKRIYLTEAGRELYGYSRSLARTLDEADEVLEQLRGVHRGHLAVSVATTANHFASRLLADFSRRFRGVSLSLDVTNRDTLLRQLVNNERDLVIMGEPPQGMDLTAEAFMDNPLVVIAPQDHPLVGRRHIPVSQITPMSFVAREPGSGTRAATERFCQARGVSFRTSMEMSGNEAIKQAVEAGLGLAVVSLHTLELELETARVAVLDVEGFPILRRWYVVQRKGKRLSPVAQHFKAYVLAEAAQYVRLPVWASTASAAPA